MEDELEKSGAEGSGGHAVKEHENEHSTENFHFPDAPGGDEKAMGHRDCCGDRAPTPLAENKIFLWLICEAEENTIQCFQLRAETGGENGAVAVEPGRTVSLIQCNQPNDRKLTF